MSAEGIGTRAFIAHRDPNEVPCNWCGDPSVLAVEMEGKFQQGKFIYACGVHVDTAERAKDAAKGKR